MKQNYLKFILVQGCNCNTIVSVVVHTNNMSEQKSIDFDNGTKIVRKCQISDCNTYITEKSGNYYKIVVT